MNCCNRSLTASGSEDMARLFPDSALQNNYAYALGIVGRREEPWLRGGVGSLEPLNAPPPFRNWKSIKAG